MVSRSRITDSPGGGLLLLEGDPAEARIMLDALSGPDQPPVEWVRRLSDGLERLTQPDVAAILLNLFLPDSQGIDTFDKTLAAAGQRPILALCRAEDEPLGRLVVERGADDFLLTDHLDPYALRHAARRMLERHAKDTALFAERERAEVTLNSIGDAVLSTDTDGRVTYLNVVAERMMGWSRAEAIGRPLTDVFHIIDATARESQEASATVVVREDRIVQLPANCLLVRRDGREYPIEASAAPIHARDGRVAGAVVVFHDATAARQLSSQQSYVAQHDVLTDLPNRMLLYDRLQQALAMARRRGGEIAVLFLDLDRFKHINDSLGHVIGDQLLQAVATRLTNGVRRSDTVGRQGGDEFIVVLSELDAPEHAGISAAKLLAALTAPYHIGSHELHVSVSIGVSLYPADGGDADTLIRHADTAMYHAKERGRNNYQFFTQEMVIGAAERQSIETGLHGALERHEFSLHYQPKIDLSTGAYVGVEALLRWHHPERGFVPPAQFVPIAEDTGLILPIGQWVLREACRQARVWLDAGLPSMPMAVNISAIEFRSQDFVDRVRMILEETGLNPHGLELEIAESVLMKHAESTVSTLKSLKQLGVRLAVDDFGTGYSSLSYLRQFPIDSLKVDQSFVQEISMKADDAAIVSAVIGMGNSLNKRVIAEGVETREQLDFLTAAGCEEAQGYYFERPMGADQLSALLEAGTSRQIPRRRMSHHERINRAARP